MTFIDLHTHRLNHSSDSLAIYQLLVENSSLRIDQIPADIPFACGIHPKDAAQENLLTLFDQIARHSHCIAIGEAGFDKLVTPSTDQQAACFNHQLSTAINNRKPLIIHCVRSYDILYQHLSNNKKSGNIPIILHGFRGKPELAKQLISRGLYLSFGPLYNILSLKTTPLDKLLIETDDSDINIEDVYKKIADDLAMPIAQLSSIIERNILDIFGEKINSYTLA